MGGTVRKARLDWMLAAAVLLLLTAAAVGQDDPAKRAAGTPPPEKVMTRTEAKKLFDSVDEITAFASAESGLPQTAKVKRRLVTRDEVTRYLVKSFDEDESAKRLQRSEIVLKKFGLLSRDFQLRSFLLSLLTEQIAGFYDDKTKTVNMLNWVDPEEQKPVLAHELTHALQDQKVNLEKWSNSGFDGISKTASEDTQRIAVDEEETARQAVAEGQAMVVFVDWSLKGTGKTLKDSPELVDRLKSSANDASSSPVMARAPLLLQRSLGFPYTDGLGFEQALLVKGGKQAAFAGALDRPPTSSFEIMHPEAYLAHAVVPVLRLPDVHQLLDAQYDPYDVGVMGELDVEMMASLFGGPDASAKLAPAWFGGVYYAAQRRSATAAEKQTTASLGVMYYSRWRTDVAAEGFEKIYGLEVGRKYTGVKERKADEQDGEEVYTTSEGDVLMWRDGDELFLSEGFPLETARMLRDQTQAVQGRGPVRQAINAPMHELGLGNVTALHGLGMTRFAQRERYTSAAHPETKISAPVR